MRNRSTYRSIAPDEWANLPDKDFQQILNETKELELSVIAGQFSPEGIALIDIELGDLPKYSGIVPKHALCVVDARSSTSNFGRGENFHYTVYVALNQGNAWLCYRKSNSSASSADFDPELYAEDGDGDGSDKDADDVYDYPPPLDDSVLFGAALRIAQASSYSVLRNKSQKFDLGLELLGGSELPPNIGMRIHEILAHAEEIFSLGVLPLAAQKLASEGKKASDISRILSISKQKAERAMLATIPEHIQKRLAIKPWPEVESEPSNKEA
jgi:hypothetical protein